MTKGSLAQDRNREADGKYCRERSRGRGRARGARAKVATKTTAFKYWEGRVASARARGPEKDSATST
ncbi:hypothetical protein CHH27_24675 [Labrenzia sp. VG12]|nr:hypothetical protein CHH27_24675 [Labrenzia sp. VG12]